MELLPRIRHGTLVGSGVRQGGSAGRTGSLEVGASRATSPTPSAGASCSCDGPGIPHQVESPCFGSASAAKGSTTRTRIEGARQIVRGQAPGRFDVDEIRADPFPSGHTSLQWGRMIRHTDGRVEDEPWPWD
jgi:hypothetical protein